MPDAVQEQLERVVALVDDVLGPDVVGVYLHGSATLGGLRPRSDLDVLVVSARRTTHEEKRRLAGRLVEISGGSRTGWATRPLEITVVAQSDVRPWRYPPDMDFQYGEWLRDEHEGGRVEPSTRANPDLTVLLTMTLLANEPLIGPPPAEVLDPVPHDDLVLAMVDGIAALLADLDADTRNVLLTLARIWSTLATGTVCSKDAAADWALRRLPDEHRAVLERARAAYLGGAEDRWDDLRPRVRLHAEHIVREIGRLSGHRRSPDEA